MRKFKTESKKLLDLMINSIYTNREIFLRELVSNASDAVDKLYFRSLTDKDVEVGKDDLAIRVAFDKDARTVTVSDNGIGMTKDELDKNLGTIAHSDSLAFKTDNAEKQGDDIDIIGQFGVGFYSAFMVASKVRVVSRAYGSDEAWAWESDGVEGYTIEEAERDGHGTDVILTLKENTEGAGEGAEAESYDTYLTEYGLKNLIKRYSNYVRYPIQMNVTKTRELPKPEDAGDDYQPQYETYTELETVNSMIPIWKRKKSDVTDEEYHEFYKSDFHDFGRPGAHHLAACGRRAHLRRAAVCSQPRALRPVQQGLQEGAGPVQLQRAHHGEVRGVAARLPELRARRGGQPRPHAQHLARDAAAQQPAEGHRAPASRRRSWPTCPTCATTTARPTRNSSATSAAG